ncbi:MAG: heme o synthase [Bacteroidota bacterium]
MSTRVKNITFAASVSQKLTDYKSLVKFRLNLTVVFSSLMAYLIAAQGVIDWQAALLLSLGGFLVTGAANALNQVLEKDYDKLMKRTEDRPIAAGRMTISEGVMSAGFMSILGIGFLASFNPWTALLGTIALMSYAFIYTPMKRVSPIAVLIGAIPGALPMMIGCVAVEGDLTSLAIALFGIQFMWQFPHFWAIAWLGHDDYHRAGFNLLPSGRKDQNVGFQATIYALMLIPLGMMPFLLGTTGLISAIIAAVAALIYAYFGWNLYRKCDRKAALQLMFSSFFYLPLVLIALYLDKII